MNWTKILSDDCTVFKIGSRAVYPIYRCGYTSLKVTADKTYTNSEIKFNNIDVLIRDPFARFVSGVNEYARQNNVNVEATWDLIAEDKLVDRHFAPQYVWLMHLQKFHKGTITLYPFNSINKFTKAHERNAKEEGTKNTAVAQIESFVEKDYKLLKHLNKTIEIKDLLKYVLS